ncbi:MAG TPA: DUF1761 domain-containing protein [Terriglobales bacterium]|nr:DUF1761 domain-containing protein [Terriglobales bacterium]
MSFMGVNLLSVLVAAVASMVIGFLWYSPMAFARSWMNLMGYAPDDKAKQEEMRKGAGKLYGMTFVGFLVSAFVLAKIIHISTIRTAVHGLHAAFAVWLGFVTTVQFSNNRFNRKPFQLYLIDTGYQLVCYLAMGAILAAWPR